MRGDPVGDQPLFDVLGIRQPEVLLGRAGMLEAERQFRRVIGYRDLGELATAVEREVAPTVTPTPTQENATLATA